MRLRSVQKIGIIHLGSLTGPTGLELIEKATSQQTERLDHRLVLEFTFMFQQDSLIFCTECCLPKQNLGLHLFQSCIAQQKFCEIGFHAC